MKKSLGWIIMDSDGCVYGEIDKDRSVTDSFVEAWNSGMKDERDKYVVVEVFWEVVESEKPEVNHGRIT